MKSNKYSRRNSKVVETKSTKDIKLTDKTEMGLSISKWEDLVQMKDKLTEDMTVQLSVLTNLCEIKKDVLEKDPKLKEEIRDVCKAYTDVAKDIRKTMSKHMEFDKKGNITKIKKGEIYDLDRKNDDVFDYLNIAGEYINESSRIMGLMEHTHISVLPKLGVYDNEIKEFKEIENKIISEGDNDGK